MSKQQKRKRSPWRRLGDAWRWLHDRWYWLTCRLWHRYNVVVCRSLRPTWCDRDHLLLYAAFQILEDFLAQEEGHFHQDVYTLYLDCGEGEARRRAAEWQELRVLYSWWRQRKNDHQFDDYETDTKMLHKLIALRGLLWT